MKRLTFSMIATMLSCILIFSQDFVNAQEIGIQMGSMGNLFREDVNKALITIKELGITKLQGGRAYGMDRDEFKNLLDQHGMQIVATGASFEKLQNKDSIMKIVENAKFYGADYVVCYWIPHDGDNFTFDDMKKGVEVFNSAGKIFSENDISFCYHPHGYEFRPYPGEGTMFDYMMNETNPEYVNFQMDVFWIRNPGQDPAAILRKYPGRFPTLHLKDRRPGSIDNQNGRQDKETNVVLGKGDVNIAEVMKAANETGVKYAIIEDESSRSIEQIPLSIEYLNSLGKDYSSKD